MLNSKLILIDGLPGLGKSTTASTFASRLKSKHFSVNLWLETETEHPLNVGGDLHPAGFTTGEALFKRYTPETFVEESLERWQEFFNTYWKLIYATAIKAGLKDDEALVRAHAVWALWKLEGRESFDPLSEHLDVETNDSVREEIESLLNMIEVG